MKSKFLTLNTPCSEKWEHMKPNAKGSFCETCAKNVIDFTKLSPTEISEKIKNSKGDICARVTKTQLETPLLDIEIQKKYKLPYSNIAASILLASTLALSTSACAQQQEKTATEFVQSNTLSSKSKIKRNQAQPEKKIADRFVTFKGKIVDKKEGYPLEKVKVTFVTIQKMFEAYSQKDGSFSMEIPAEFVDDDNVVRVSFVGVEPKSDGSKPNFTIYETTDYLLSKKEVTSNYTVNAIQHELYLGGIGFHRTDINPIVLCKQKKLDYKEFAKVLVGEKSSYTSYYTDYYHYYFAPKMAVAIYGEEAKDGLYILVDPPKE